MTEVVGVICTSQESIKRLREGIKEGRFPYRIANLVSPGGPEDVCDIIRSQAPFHGEEKVGTVLPAAKLAWLRDTHCVHCQSFKMLRRWVILESPGLVRKVLLVGNRKGRYSDVNYSAIYRALEGVTIVEVGPPKYFMGQRFAIEVEEKGDQQELLVPAPAAG
ncbi:MAG: hypothetical protein HY459_02160 [Parcubacteria group bacterium]|nr:hypothetical protein [Parcubacteria group bacterium]